MARAEPDELAPAIEEPDPLDAPARTAPARSGRIVAGMVDALAVVGLVVTVVLFLVGMRIALDLADRLREALGGRPPAEGVDWFTVVVLALLALVPVLLVLLAARVLRRRFERRLRERFGDPSAARRFSAKPSPDRRAWLAGVLETPHWQPLAERWRADGRLTAGPAGWSDADYRQAAALVRRELDERIAGVALVTGVAVAVAQRRSTDAVAVVAGSAELQVEALATLGLRPTARTWLRVARAASTGVVASTYVDVEERFDLQLAIRAAALGLDESGNLLEEAGDEIQEALSEAAQAGGAIGGAIQALAGTTLGITGNVIRQVSDFVVAAGDEITEGVIVASLLHYHGMSLVADALALDAEHHAELRPRLGHVPRSLRDGGMAMARRRTAALRRMLRRRMVQAARRAPGSLRGRVMRRGRPPAAELEAGEE